MAHCARMQAKIEAFFEDCRLYEEDNQGEPVYLVYMWGEDATSGLASLPAPAVGNFCHYIRILSGKVDSWPEKGLHPEINARNIIGIKMDLTCAPYGESLPDRAWTVEGTVTHSIYGAQTTLGDMYRPLTDELTGLYSITGWVTFVTASTQTIFSYQISGSDHLRLSYSGANLVVTRAVSASYTLSQSHSVSTGTTVHFALINDGTNLVFYVNGVQAGTNAIGSALPADGTLFLGNSASTESGLAFDGFRAWEDTALTAAQTLALYTAEAAIKADALNDTENYSLVGMPPFWSTPNNNGNIDNPGYGVLGGVNGTAPALVEWRISPTTLLFTRAVWMGNKPSATTLTVADNFIYSTISGVTNATGTDYMTFSPAVEPAKVRGRAHMIAQFSSDGGTVKLGPAYTFVGTSFYVVDGIREATIPDSATPVIYDLGDINISWPTRNISPDIRVGFVYTVLTLTPDLAADYAVLLPHPTCIVTKSDAATFTGANTLVIAAHNEEAFVENLTTNDLIYYYERQGTLIIEPLKYNYVIVLVGAEGGGIHVTGDWTITPVVTQRWLLPGGMIA